MPTNYPVFRRHYEPTFTRNLHQHSPKQNSPYVLAKKCQFQQRDYEQAEKYYLQAIKEKDRISSAVKDYATLLHQKGKTEEALKLLQKYRSIFTRDTKRFQNLYKTLKNQLETSPNSLTKSLKIFPLKPEDTVQSIRSLFANPVRILQIELKSQYRNSGYFALVHFSSHSSAKKTLEGFSRWDLYSVFWVSDTGDVKGDAHYARNKMAEYRKHHPTFEYKMFLRETTGYVFSITVDGEGVYQEDEELSDQEGKVFLGPIFHDIN